MQKAESHLQKKRMESGFVALQANRIATVDANQRATDYHSKQLQATSQSVLRSWKLWRDGESEMQEKERLISRKHKATVLKSALHVWDWQVAEIKAAREEAEVNPLDSLTLRPQLARAGHSCMVVLESLRERLHSHSLLGIRAGHDSLPLHVSIAYNLYDLNVHP